MESKTVSAAESVVPEFLSGGGEMGQFIRSKDWSKTPLGPPDTWPQSLRTTVSTCLNSRFPILIWWGPELVMIYNDAYRPILGAKHPASMGEKGEVVWPEVWDIIGPMLHGVYEQGISTWSENQLLLFERNGYAEECYFTFSYSPIHVESGGIGGVYCAVTETTQTVLNERQSQTLRDLSNIETVHKTVDSVYAEAVKVLEKNNKDFPFAVIYKIENGGTTALPVAYASINEEQTAFPDYIDIANPVEGMFNFCRAYQTNSIVLSENKGRRKNLPAGSWEKEATHFVHLPVTKAGNKYPHAILSAALNPYRQYDDTFRQFTKLIADQIALEVNNAVVYEEERKRAEALAEIDKAKTLFFSNISHEFRTPLTLMLGSLEELLLKRNDELGASDKAIIETTHRNAMRLLRLVNHLLDFSRIEAGRVQAQYQLTDIARYTKDLAANFTSVMEHAGLSFHVQADAIVQPVYIDKEMWEKIILNLLSNAFKYTFTGSVTLSLTAGNNQVVLTVKDTGIGIPESELPKMFQRFHRVQQAVGRTYEGTGIGLSLVSELVKLHGGEISVRSESGAGSEFTVSIPTGKAHLPAEQVVEKEVNFNGALTEAFIEEAAALIEQPLSNRIEEAEQPNGATVLVVDDNADMREHLKAILSRQYHVITASNGMNALHQMQTQLPQLIVSDVMMPIMDGIQLLKAVKQNITTQHIPVLLLSARAGEESKIEGYDIGADDYLVKPFSAKELLARVRAHINIAQARQANEQKIKNFFMQAPAAIAIVHGPDHIVTLANPLYQKLFSRTEEQLIGRSVRQIWPEVEGQGIYELFHQVFTSGEPFLAHEFAASFIEEGVLKNGFYDFVAQPIKNSEGAVTDIMIHALEVTEQVKAKKVGEQSGVRLRNLVQQAPVAMCVLRGPDYVVEVANERILELWGKTAEQMLDRPVFEAMPDAAGQGFEELLRKVYTTGTRFIANELSIELMRKGKKEKVFLNFVYEPLHETDGTISGVVAVATEVTEQVTARKKIEESESRLRIAIEAGQLGTFEIDLVHPGIIYSERLAEIFGLSTSQNWTHQELKERIHPGDEAIRSKAYETALQTGFIFYEVRVIWNDGSVHWVRIHGRVMYNDSVPIRMLGTAMDITEEKRITQIVKESEQQLRIAIEGGELGLYDFYPQTGELIWSSKTKEFFGLPPEAAIDFEVYLNALHPDDKESTREALQKAINAKSSNFYENEYRIIGITDGRLRWLRSKAKISYDAEGKVVRMTGVVQDITRQKEILASLQLQSLVLDRMEEGVSVSDEKGYILLTNPAEDKMFGYETGELTGRHVTVQNAYSPAENERIVNEVITELKQKGFWNGEWHNQRKDGTDFYTYSFITSLMVDGKTLFVCVQRDITEEKQAKAQLKQSEEQFRNFSNNLQNLAWMADSEGWIYWYNQRWYDYTGTTLEEMQGWGWEKVHHPDHINRVLAFVKEAWKKDEPFELTFPLRSRNGTYRWFLTRVVPVKDAKGKVYRWVGTNTDVHEQKLAEERFRTLAESLPQLVWTTNEKGEQEYASSRWKEYTGIEPQGWESWQQMVHPHDRTAISKAWRNSLETGDLFRSEARLKNSQGDYRWHFVQGEPIRNEEGAIIKWIGALTDIHDQKTLSEKLEQLVKERTIELKKSNEDLEQFAHVASHDLKEPLRKIKTFGSLLKSEFGESLPEKAKVYLGKMETAANRMYDMIDGVLLYSSLNATQETFEEVDLNKVVNNIESDLEVLIQQKEAAIEYSNLPVIKASPILMHQLLYNLINNALKFSKADKKPCITIHSKMIAGKEVGNMLGQSVEDVYTQIVIRDNGIGFDQSQAEKIFKTFTRLNSKDRYEGTGLGLALCKKIVERHHGAIYAEGKEGEGATFTIALPLKQS